jgi:hypothetical protein
MQALGKPPMDVLVLSAIMDLVTELQTSLSTTELPHVSRQSQQRQQRQQQRGLQRRHELVDPFVTQLLETGPLRCSVDHSAQGTRLVISQSLHSNSS